MKKLILFITVLLIGVSGFSQDKAVTLKPDSWFQEFTFTTADSITNNDTVYSIEYVVNKPGPVKYSAAVTMHKTSGNPRVVAKLQAKIFATDAYSDLGTVTWCGTTSDSTFLYSQVSTLQYYRYFRLYFDANTTAQKSRITAAKIKFWQQ